MFLSGSLQSGLSVKRGCEIRLDANVSGSPYPQITWYWNNQVIRPEALRKRPEKPLKKKVEKKEEVKTEEGEAEKKEEKEGEEKKEGEVKEGEEKKEGEVKEGEVKEAEGKEGEEKKEETAQPEVEETDYPTINERLAIDNRHRGSSSIAIRDSLRVDHGVYMVKVENDHGSASATCEVNVLGEDHFRSIGGIAFYVKDIRRNKNTLCGSTDTPGPPVNFTFEEVRKNSVICRWSPPLDDGGSEILNYTLEKKDNSKLEIGWSCVTSTLRGCRYLVPKLIEKKEYIFRVVAENKLGAGPHCISKALIAKNPFGMLLCTIAAVYASSCLLTSSGISILSDMSTYITCCPHKPVF